MRFINDNVTITQTKRTVPKISKEELWEKIVDYVATMAEKYSDEYNEDNAEYYIPKFVQCGGISGDVPYVVNSENIICTTRDVKGKYIGLHTLPNGFSFFGFLMGGDWEIPIFMALYYNGDEVACYVPRKGNLINLDCMSAFGSEEDGLAKCHINEKSLVLKYKLSGLISIFAKKYNLTNLYCKKFGLSKQEMIYNYDAIAEDIAKTFIIE